MKNALSLALLVSAACAGCATPAVDTRAAAPRAIFAPAQADDPYFKAADARLESASANERARNVIIFIGDGMGVSTVTAARIYAGQRQGRDGESYTLAMDAFPHTALARTYGHDSQVSDSAPTATALVAGVKTSNGVIGLTAEAPPGRCEGSLDHRADSLFEIAEAIGLSTGIVSTARITHATPAAAYAHTANRGWENDAEAARRGGSACVDIARQLIEMPAERGFEVVLGGGRANFLPSTVADPEHADVRGARGDGRNLAEEWAARADHLYVWNSAQLAAAPDGARVLGLFSPSHMAYESNRASDPGGEPSLAELTAAAIARLSRDQDGYVLMVEGGRIDHAHHAGQAGQALSEAVAFDDAVRTALEMTNRDDTLIIVTADHSHTLSISGYAPRGTPILGLSRDARGELALAQDGRPYTTLGYANGPGSVFAPATPGAAPVATERPDHTHVDTTTTDYRAQALVPLASETHAGEDVAVYAWGPGDEMIAGTLEQNVVFHVMARALGIEWR